MDPNSEFKKALAYHRQGDLHSAGALYDSLLKTDPNQTRILHLAGVLAQQKGDLEKAGRLISRAVSIAPGDAAYQISLGAVLKANGRLSAAREVLEKASQLIPADFEIVNELGDIANTMGDYSSAIAYFTRAVSMAPSSAAAHFNLGLAHRNHGDIATALELFTAAAALDPGLAEAHYAMGNLKLDAGHFGDAIHCYRKTVNLLPDFSDAHYNMGNAARAIGETGLAIECFERAIEIQPDYGEAYNNLGLIYKDANQISNAIVNFEKASQVKPELVEAIFNIGICEQLRGQYEAGLKWFEKALKKKPDYAPAKWMWHLSLPILYRHTGEIDRYRQRFKTGLASLIASTPLQTSADARLALKGVGSMTNFFLQYQALNDREEQRAYGAFVNRILAAIYPEWSQKRTSPPVEPATKIRVGYVSSFMRAHTVGEFLAGWIEHHDRSKFDIFCYHIGCQTDAMTPRFEESCAHFYQIGDNLEAAASRIIEDDLHVLVFTDIGMNPLATQLAALKLAPIQCKGWGHPVTTGLPTIDYYLSSDLMEPDNAQDHYSETLVRLPNLALAYSPPDLPKQPKSRADFGLHEEAFVCLNSQSLFKFLPQHDDIYPRIALEVPRARFVFLAHKDPDVTGQFVERLEKAFAAHRLKCEAFVRILPRQNFPDFLSLNGASDILLDSFGWSGGKTTLEAISCGLPVVTMPGEFMRGRHTYAMLTMMGMDATIARDKTDYVRIVSKLYHDKAFYDRIKTQINRNRSRLYADSSCIRALEDFYRSVSCRNQLANKTVRFNQACQTTPSPASH